ncbi:1-phosphofructokinase family hexose kinase [Gordonia sp. w5E2]|uniref:1-phosphofructokinase n=1 Tax=Gordonia jacobaea TaxID=122202 RepID=A0ABR5IHC1_9ACTN|nr:MULTISPECIES: 1-phosphofructokinase family hexose kinase [Gordonia]KNA93078.1 1-phosphofructokinase [Gordonia jacobaea]SKZ36725.1 1-phosphofructokinase [Mycobacteroides abscessus subsp. abscessus]
MILTVTANPSLDRTLEIAGPLMRGEVQRSTSTRVEPGGKGVNVSRVVAEAGIPTVAVLPAHADDPLLTALDAVALPYRTVDIDGQIRTNITVAENDGTTTKINAPGHTLTPAELDDLTALVLGSAEDASWVALCGSLPPGVPDDWYRRISDRLVTSGRRVAIDTSGAPLSAAMSGPIDLVKPNDEELAEVSGIAPAELAAAIASGDYLPVVAASRTLIATTQGAVLATLGAAGAVLTTAEGSWLATPPPIVPRSTVGAGDASLAGYLIAYTAGASEPDRLRTAVAYGSAAAGLAGTQPPLPAQVDVDSVDVVELSGAAPIT